MSKIPDKVVFFQHPAKQVTMLNGDNMQVCSSYPAYHASKARMASGAKWAQNDKGIEVDNRFTKIQIHKLEERGEGGRAYKVLVDDAFYVDLREEPLMDMLNSCGVQIGGFIMGDFCFAVASEFKLMRRFSPAYQSIVKSDEATAAKKALPKTNKFKYGHLYATEAGSKRIFLGVVSVPDTVEDPDYHGTGYTYRNYKGFKLADTSQVREMWVDQNAFDNNNNIKYLYSHSIAFTKSSRMVDLNEQYVTLPLASLITKIQEKVKKDERNETALKVHALNIRCFKIDAILADAE